MDLQCLVFEGVDYLLRAGSNMDFCQYGNETSGSIRSWNFLDELSYSQVYKKEGSLESDVNLYIASTVNAWRFW
jgi:hypothetical protein